MRGPLPSLLRVYAIARNTFIEAIRARVLQVLVLFGIILVIGSNFFTDFAVVDQIKFLKDLGHAAISWTGFLIALMGAAQLIPAEIERRTIYTILSKPVRPSEFIFGKFLGLTFLLTLIVVVMSFIFWGVLLYKEHTMLADFLKLPELNDWQQSYVNQIRHSFHDPHLLQAIILLWARLIVVAAISVFLSTIATSTTFVICLTLLIYLIGCLRQTAYSLWQDANNHIPVWGTALFAVVSFFVPDFTSYSIIDEIIAGNAVHWSTTLNILAYSLIYVAILLGCSSVIFESREL